MGNCALTLSVRSSSSSVYLLLREIWRTIEEFEFEAILAVPFGRRATTSHFPRWVPRFAERLPWPANVATTASHMSFSSVGEKYVSTHGIWRRYWKTTATDGQSYGGSKTTSCNYTTVFRSSNLRLWLWLTRVINPFSSLAMTAGFCCGVGRLLNVGDLLKQIVSMLTALLRVGIKFGDFCVTVHLVFVLCDIPARAFIH